MPRMTLIALLTLLCRGEGVNPQTGIAVQDKSGYARSVPQECPPPSDLQYETQHGRRGKIESCRVFQ